MPRAAKIYNIYQTCPVYVMLLLRIHKLMPQDFTAPLFPIRFAKTKPTWNQKPGKY